MRSSVLDMTQTILSSLGSDAVNSIGDTTESMQVAEIIRTCYYNIAARSNLPESRELFQLEASLDEDMPVLMFRPENIDRIDWIKYNVSEAEQPEVNIEPTYRYVTILPIEQYLEQIHNFDVDAVNVGKMVLNDITFYFENDRMPMYCCILSDRFIIFDAYNKEWDATLQNAKTLCLGEVARKFLLENEYVPELDDQQFPLLLNEAKSLAFFELKQIPHEKAEQESRRQWRTIQRVKNVHHLSDFDRLPNFGRRK